MVLRDFERRIFQNDFYDIIDFEIMRDFQDFVWSIMLYVWIRVSISYLRNHVQIM